MVKKILKSDFRGYVFLTSSKGVGAFVSTRLLTRWRCVKLWQAQIQVLFVSCDRQDPVQIFHQLSKIRSFVWLVTPAFSHQHVDFQRAARGFFHSVAVPQELEQLFYAWYRWIRCTYRAENKHNLLSYSVKDNKLCMASTPAEVKLFCYGSVWFYIFSYKVLSYTPCS